MIEPQLVEAIVKLIMILAVSIIAAFLLVIGGWIHSQEIVDKILNKIGPRKIGDFISLKLFGKVKKDG